MLSRWTIAEHIATLSIPENIVLLFQPSYSPEVNPIERLWLELKKQLKKLVQRFRRITSSCE